MFIKKTGLFIAIVAFMSIFLAACTAPGETIEVTRVVSSEVTRVVRETVVAPGQDV